MQAGGRDFTGGARSVPKLVGCLCWRVKPRGLVQQLGALIHHPMWLHGLRAPPQEQGFGERERERDIRAETCFLEFKFSHHRAIFYFTLAPIPAHATHAHFDTYNRSRSCATRQNPGGSTQVQAWRRKIPSQWVAGPKFSTPRQRAFRLYRSPAACSIS